MMTLLQLANLSEHLDNLMYALNPCTLPFCSPQVPLIPMPPEWREGSGLRLIEGQDVTQELNDIIGDMVSHMNEGIKTLPDLSSRLT